MHTSDQVYTSFQQLAVGMMMGNIRHCYGTWLISLLHQGGHVSMCLFVDWVIYQQDYWKSADQISTKLGWGMGLRPEQIQLTLGGEEIWIKGWIQGFLLCELQLQVVCQI